MTVMPEPSGISHLIEKNPCMGFFSNSVDWEIHPEETLGHSLTHPPCCFSRNLSLLLSPLPCSSSHMDDTLGNSDCQGDGLLA